MGNRLQLRFSPDNNRLHGHPQPLRSLRLTLYLRRTQNRQLTLSPIHPKKHPRKIQNHPLRRYSSPHSTSSAPSLLPFLILNLVQQRHDQLQTMRSLRIQMFEVFTAHFLEHRRPRHELLHQDPEMIRNRNSLLYIY